MWVVEHPVPVGHLFSGEIEMPKPQALELLMLLSALESWGFSTGKAFPDFLLDRLIDAMDKLRKEVLECPAK